MEITLVLNGSELNATTNESELVVLAVASGELCREGLIGWVQAHCESLT